MTYEHSSKDQCGRCGRAPASGFATIDGVRYCHGDDGPDPTCYMEAQWDAPVESAVARKFLGDVEGPERLPRTVVDLAGGVLEHGERGEHDPDHPGACFCGELDYLACPDFVAGEHVGSWVIHPAQIDESEAPR